MLRLLIFPLSGRPSSSLFVATYSKSLHTCFPGGFGGCFSEPVSLGKRGAWVPWWAAPLGALFVFEKDFSILNIPAYPSNMWIGVFGVMQSVRHLEAPQAFGPRKSERCQTW